MTKFEQVEFSENIGMKLAFYMYKLDLAIEDGYREGFGNECTSLFCEVHESCVNLISELNNLSNDIRQKTESEGFSL